MASRRTCNLGVVFLVAATLAVPARAQLVTGGESVLGRLNPFKPFDPSQPISVIELSKHIDCVSERLRNDGLIVLKQPDVFGQARLTRYRKDIETEMYKDLGRFHLVLAARIGRLDSATTTSTTSLAAALSAPGTTNVHVPSASGGASTAGAAGVAVPTLPTAPPFGAPDALPTAAGTAFANLGLDTNMAAAAGSNLSLGVDPTVYLDEKKRFLEHLNEIRRINLGPDQNDSSGYGLYVVRMPVSITPGECTYQGHGAEVAVTVEHEFPKDFLWRTFRDMVVNDVVDHLGPVVFEVIRSDVLYKQLEAYYEGPHSQDSYYPNSKSPEDTDLKSRGENDLLQSPDVRALLNRSLPATRTQKEIYPIAPREIINFYLLKNVYVLAKDAKQSLLTQNPRATDVRNYLRQSLYVAYNAMVFVPPARPAIPVFNHPDLIERISRAVQSRAFGHEVVDLPTAEVYGYRRSLLEKLYQELETELLKAEDHLDANLGSVHQPLGALCWAIAVDAGLLDHGLHYQINKVFRDHDVDYQVPPEMYFYRQQEMLDEGAKNVFNDFVRFKWPIITFALDPVAEQQNVADSFNLKRDLQLALSYAFATGQVSFNQMNTFRRQIEQSSDTIALNRTVSGFAHGNDTFGFRFTPRFQNPPNQRTNLRVITSQLISGGPGPDYQIKHSKLEPGLREITAILLLPAFMPTLRMEVATNWFKLNDPEHLIFHTKRGLERGRQVQELRRAVVDACSAGEYRAADLRVLQAKLHQLDQMLPAQSTVIQLPYESMSNGFELLYSEGANALVPQLTGYDGADYILQGTQADIYLMGKFISILDTKVIVGGQILDSVTPGSTQVEILSREVVHIQIPKNANPTVTEDGKTYFEVYLATPNGISNRILIPCLPATPTPQVAFDLNPKSASLNIFYRWDTGPDGKPTGLIATQDPSGGGKTKINITWTSPTAMAPKTLQATFQGTVNGQLISFSLPADTGTSGDYAVDSALLTVALLEQLGKTVTYPSLPADTVSLSIQVQPYLPQNAMGYRVLPGPLALKTPLTVKLVATADGTNALPGVTPPPPAPPKPAAGAQGSRAPTDSPTTPEGERDSHVLKTSQLPLQGVSVSPPFIPPPGTPPAIANALVAGMPPLPPLPPLPNVPALPTGALGAATSAVASRVAPVPTPSIVVNPSPVVVIAPPSMAPSPTRHHRLRIFDHKKKGAPPAQPPR